MNIAALGLMAVSIPFAVVHIWLLRECHEDCLIAWATALAAAVILWFAR